MVSHEVERIGDNVEETVISKDRKLQNTAPDVPPEADAAAEETPDGQELQTFDDFCEPALEGPPHGFTKPYEHKKKLLILAPLIQKASWTLRSRSIHFLNQDVKELVVQKTWI